MAPDNTISTGPPREPTGNARARENALREVLGAINASRGDERPVFEVIVRNAAGLCNARLATLTLVNDARTQLSYVTHWGVPLKLFQPGVTVWPLDDPIIMCRAVQGRKAVHIEDLADDNLYRDGDPTRVGIVDREGVRTLLAVPLIRDGEAIGAIGLHRNEVRPFADSEIALVEAFAEQAVIAIENVRQFRELQSRLEREAATREILQVISQSRTETAPVFEVILRNAARLCGAPLANLVLVNAARSHQQLVAHFGDGLRHLAIGLTTPLDAELVPTTAIRTARVVQIVNLANTDLYRKGDPGRVAMVDAEGMRTIVCVPLFSGDEAIGGLTLFRRTVQAFSEDEIALVETFAEQAVIAIENVRQFSELQTRLEREAATREVLEVISRSRDDDAPVFEVILRHARRLCEAPFAALVMAKRGDAHQAIVAHHGAIPSTIEIYRSGGIPMDPKRSFAARAIYEKRVVHLEDMSDTDEYRAGVPNVVTLVKEQGIRTNLFVPLIAEEGGIGSFILFRHEVRPFTESQIELVSTFAAQAVIAIENVRQFKVLQTRTAEVEALNTGLEDRVATQVDQLERLGRLRRFLSPQVADAVVSSGADGLLSSHRALIAILFCDIRGFTAFCESAEPEEAIEVLQTYHESLGKLIHQAGAGFDHRAGDGIMVIFNDPIACDDPAGDALRTAVAMRARMDELCRDWRKLGHRLGFGVGISLGYATVGMVGFEGRYDYTASGTAVNLASRLCDHAADREILLSPRAAIAVEDIAEMEPAGDLTLKGFHAPVVAMRVTEMKA